MLTTILLMIASFGLGAFLGLKYGAVEVAKLKAAIEAAESKISAGIKKL